MRSGCPKRRCRAPGQSHVACDRSSENLHLTRWLQACNRSELGNGTEQISETTTLLTNGSEVDYAWGVRVTTHAAGRLLTHGGSWYAWLTKTVRIPEQQVAVVIMSLGSSELDVSRTGTDLADAVSSH